jgi:hypothetical protein
VPKCFVRDALDKTKLIRFMDEIGKAAKGPGRVYLVGGATALLLNIRTQTIDIDIKLDPEPSGVFEAIAILKDRLNVSVELAAPDDFLPALRGWRERSEFIARRGEVDFYHYDYYGQALSKLLRCHRQDLTDVEAYVGLGKVAPQALLDLLLQVSNELIRYPAIDRERLVSRVESFVRDHEQTN